MKRSDERRLVENEVLFKQINTDIDDFVHDIGVQHVILVRFFCECSDLRCKQRVELSAAEYERIHQIPSHFILIAGHENREIEKVTERHDGYFVVEKFQELPKPEEVAHRLNELED